MKKIYPLRSSFSTDSGYFNKNLINHSFTLIQLSNDLFLWSLPFLIIGGFLWVFSSGFFDHFQRSVHLARTRNRKKNQNFPRSRLPATVCTAFG